MVEVDDMKRIKTLLFLYIAARRYEYIYEDSPVPEECNPPDRGPTLSASPPAAPMSPSAVACFSTRKAFLLRLGHVPNDVVGRRVRAAISDCTIRCSHASEHLEQSKKPKVNIF